MKFNRKTCISVAAVALALFLCIYYWKKIEGFFILLISAATPLIAGMAIAYVLNILMSFYERHYFNKFSNKKIVVKSRRPICLIAAFFTLCAIISVVVGLVIPELISCIKLLVTAIPPFINRVLSSDFVTTYVSKEVVAWATEFNWKEYISNIAEFLLSGIGSAADAVMTAISSVVSVVVTIFIAVTFCIYLLWGRDTLKHQCSKIMHIYIPVKLEKKIRYLIEVLNDSFRKFIVGQCTEAVILGALCTLGMLIFRFPYAGMIGTLIGFTALIPIAGAYIGAIVGATVILTVSPLKALLFIIFLIILQQLENNLIYPKVVGKSIGLPAIWVLTAITIGGGIMGVYGMLLGVPIASAVYRLLSENMKARAKKNGEKLCE